ncbi:hypothetical protein KBA63_00150 [Candidatus Woesebacteria bacterium]|nr:hypothetical protein [Candidatus Woesebacteria bacterium]
MNEEKELSKRIDYLASEVTRVVAALEDRIAKLEKVDVLENTEGVKPEAPKPPIRPREGYEGKYWLRSCCGGVDFAFEHGDDTDDHRYNTGNYFLTKEACQAYCTETNAKEIALHKIKDWIMAKGYEYTPQWVGENNYYLEYCVSNNEWSVQNYCNHITLGVPFWFSQNPHAEECIRDCEEELNTLIGLK